MLLINLNCKDTKKKLNSLPQSAVHFSMSAGTQCGNTFAGAPSAAILPSLKSRTPQLFRQSNNRRREP